MASCKACRRNARDSANIVLDSDLVAGAARDMMTRTDPRPDGSKLWEGLTSELLKQLRSTVGEASWRAGGMPKAANALSGYLRRATPALAKIGIIVRQRHVEGGGWVSIYIEAPPQHGESPADETQEPRATEERRAAESPEREAGSAETFRETPSGPSGSSAEKSANPRDPDGPDGPDDVSGKSSGGAENRDGSSPKAGPKVRSIF